VLKAKRKERERESEERRNILRLNLLRIKKVTLRVASCLGTSLGLLKDIVRMHVCSLLLAEIELADT
jgi:hypothetical protein